MTTLTAADLAAYVNAPLEADLEFLTTCAATATQLVTKAIGKAKVPDEAFTSAALEVGANLFHRRASTRDASMTDGDLAPAFFRPALDPLTPARPILAPYLGPGIA